MHALKPASLPARMLPSSSSDQAGCREEAETIVSWIKSREHADLRRFALLFEENEDGGL
jgi:hypothetical protein